MEDKEKRPSKKNSMKENKKHPYKNKIEDLEFVKRTEESYEEHQKGKFVSKSEKEFKEELKKC